MTAARRYLPSTALLQAFESAARLENFTLAAAELSLTQSAVSRQVRALEDIVGRPLFHRERQTVRLTPLGEAYARDVRQALAIISSATLGCRANPAGGVLNLAILPTFGTRWLLPRLSRFQEREPGITLNLTTRLVPFDFDFEPIDVAIHFGRDEWPGARLDRLMTEEVLPVCSSAFRRSYALATPQDLLNVPLINVASRPNGWRRWFARHGIDHDHGPAMTIDQFATAAQVAAAGLGVALLPMFLVRDEIDSNALVKAIDVPPMSSDECYYLAYPIRREDYPPLRAFRDWLRAETADV